MFEALYACFPLCLCPGIYMNMPKGKAKGSSEELPLANKGGHYEYKQREIRMSLRSYCLTLIIYASKEVLQVY